MQNSAQNSVQKDGVQKKSDRNQRLSFIEKIGYGLGDAGLNFYWVIIGSYLLYFYTDIFGLSAAVAGNVMAVIKVGNAFFDPVIGIVADRTQTRFGKFRPYLLLGALPLAAAGILTLTTPTLDSNEKIVWAYLTYALLMLCYSIICTPYASLAGVMTAEKNERNSIFGIRFFCAYFTGIVVGAATPDIANYFGQGNATLGWQRTMMLYSAVATLFFWITFFVAKERITPPKTQENNSWQDLRELLKNRAWFILFILALIIMLTIVLRGTSAAYYFKYFVNRPDLMGTFIGLQFAAYAVGALAYPYLAKLCAKAKLLAILMGIVGVLCVALYFIPKPGSVGVVTIDSNESRELMASDLLASQHQAGDTYEWISHEKIFWIFEKSVKLDSQSETLALLHAKGKVISVIRTRLNEKGETIVQDSSVWPKEIKWMFILSLFISLALGPKSPLTWSMLADTADYNEWKTGRRATGLTFSAATFSQKLGAAGATYAIANILANYGYAANQAQSDASLSAILWMQSFLPALFAFVAICALYFYDLSDEKLEQIQAELKARDALSAD